MSLDPTRGDGPVEWNRATMLFLILMTASMENRSDSLDTPAGGRAGHFGLEEGGERGGVLMCFAG